MLNTLPLRRVSHRLCNKPYAKNPVRTLCKTQMLGTKKISLRGVRNPVKLLHGGVRFTSFTNNSTRLIPPESGKAKRICQVFSNPTVGCIMRRIEVRPRRRMCKHLARFSSSCTILDVVLPRNQRWSTSQPAAEAKFRRPRIVAESCVAWLRM